MHIKILSIIFLFLFSAFAGSIKDETESLIKQKLGKNVKLEFMKYQIPKEIKREIEFAARQRFYGKFVYLYKIFEGDSLKHFAVLDNVLGKSMPITFLVIFEPDGTIKHSAVVKYREPYGGGVKTDEWNSQFRGKDSSSGYKIGEDISAISGATISVNSVTRGIKKLTLLIPKIKDHL